MLSRLFSFGVFAVFITLWVVVPFYLLVEFLGGKLGWTPERQSKVAKAFLCVGVVLFAFVFRMGFVILGSVAEGMEWDSPDGRYSAGCWVGTEVGFFGSERDYVRYQVVERATGHHAVQVEEPRLDPTQKWNVRAEGKVLWTPDAKRVTFSFGEGHQREFKVP